MIRAAIHGRIGGDPVTRTTRNGKTMVTVSLAVDVARPDEDQDTEWFSIVAFGATAEMLARHQKDVAAVSGSLSRSRFTGRDGQERISWSLTAESIVSTRTVRPGGRPRAAAKPQKRQTQMPQRGFPRGNPLPDDRVDDLYADGLVPS